MKIIKINAGIDINIIHESVVNDCAKSGTNVYNYLEPYKTTKEQVYDNSEYFDYVNYYNNKNDQKEDLSWPDNLQKLFEKFDFMKNFYIIRKSRYFALVHKADVHLII